MTLLERIQSITLRGSQYAALAAVAVAKVQAEVGSAKGDPAVQQTKFQAGVAYVLAAAHAGEEVPIAKVQQIAVAVELAVSIAKMFGLGGKTAGSATVVSVPAATPATV